MEIKGRSLYFHNFIHKTMKRDHYEEVIFPMKSDVFEADDRARELEGLLRQRGESVVRPVKRRIKLRLWKSHRSNMRVFRGRPQSLPQPQPVAAAAKLFDDFRVAMRKRDTGTPRLETRLSSVIGIEWMGSTTLRLAYSF